MAVPKSKKSKSRRGMRRSHDALKPQIASLDSNSGSVRRSHHIDLKDGYYNSRQVIEIFDDEDDDDDE